MSIPTDTLFCPSHRAGLQLALHRKAAPTGPTGPNGAAVLFVHGSSFPTALAADFVIDQASWMDSLSAAGYAVYGLDFLGYGAADRYPEMQLSSNPICENAPGRAMQVAADLAHAIARVRRDSRCQQLHVVAHSWGGSVALRCLSNYPEAQAQVTSLVLLASILSRETDQQAAGSVPAAAYLDMSPQQRWQAMADLSADPSHPWLAAEVQANWRAAWLASDMQGQSAHPGLVRFPNGPNQDLADLLAGRTYYELSRLSLPVLLLRGDADTYPTDADYRLLLAQLRHTASRYTCIANASHVLHLEQARAQVMAHFAQWLADMAAV